MLPFLTGSGSSQGMVWCSFQRDSEPRLCTLHTICWWWDFMFWIVWPISVSYQSWQWMKSWALQPFKPSRPCVPNWFVQFITFQCNCLCQGAPFSPTATPQSTQTTWTTSGLQARPWAWLCTINNCWVSTSPGLSTNTYWVGTDQEASSYLVQWNRNTTCMQKLVRRQCVIIVFNAVGIPVSYADVASIDPEYAKNLQVLYVTALSVLPSGSADVLFSYMCKGNKCLSGICLMPKTVMVCGIILRH